MLRCELEDRPGSLAKLAGTVAEAGGDIQAVDVVETEDGRVLDDLVVVVDDGDAANLLARVAALDRVDLIHAGPSRGHPGDAVTRLAIGLEALLVGSAEPDLGVTTLLGGLLRASTSELVAHAATPRADGRTLVLPLDDRALVLTRDYRFTATERQRAEALLRVCHLIRSAAAIRNR